MPKILMDALEKLITRRYGQLALMLLAFSALTCKGNTSASSATELVKTLALREELEGTSEAVVWIYDIAGSVQTYWIKSDVTGVAVVASRPDLVVPTEGALWRFPTIERDEDIDAIKITDLVSDRANHLVLDESFVTEEEDDIDEPDASVDEEAPDAGAPEPIPATAGASPEDEEDEAFDDTDPSRCETRIIQSDLVIFATVGPYLFLRFAERTYDCTDALILLEDRFEAFDLRDGTTPDILTDAETEKLFDHERVRRLAQEGPVVLMGIAPFYNSAFELGITYHFAVKQSYVSEDGDHHSYTSAVEVLATEIPVSLVPYAAAPSFAQAFGLSAPQTTTPGGIWLVYGTAEQIAKQLSAFVVSTRDDGGNREEDGASLEDRQRGVTTRR